MSDQSSSSSALAVPAASRRKRLLSVVVLENLPDAMLALILAYLTFSDRQRLVLSTCRALRSRFTDLHLLVCTATVTSMTETELFQERFAGAMTNLIQLDLERHCTDAFLHSLYYCGGGGESAVVNILPNLRSISMVASQVTDKGLLSLCQGTDRAKNLHSIDITYCHNTTYQGTFVVRDALPNLRLLRRQPAWLDGCYETPFDDDGLHVYYADGSFEFERRVQCRGFVVSWNKWTNDDPYFVFDKLQYADFVPPRGWPVWTRFCYRPGVSLLKLTDCEEVLVGQCTHGLRPPRNFPRYEHAQVIDEPKRTRFFDRDGALLPATEDPDPATVRQRHILVSRMRSFPLISLMPPKELVEQNRCFCREMKAYWDQQPWSPVDAEDFLHQTLSS